MNVICRIILVCSLYMALLTTLVQQWVRAYMRIFQQSSNPLKTARIRLFLFEGAERLPVVAEAVPGLIHVSSYFSSWDLVTSSCKSTQPFLLPPWFLRGLRMPLSLLCDYTNMKSPIALSDPIFRLHLVSRPKTASQSLL